MADRKSRQSAPNTFKPTWLKVRKLGQGGMAETHLCVRREPSDARGRKTTIEERACCKRLRPDLSANPEVRASLDREASIVATLRHSNIAQLRGFDLAEGELYFELVDGVDLRTLLADVRRLSGPLTTYLGIEVCKGLAYAHTRTRRGQREGVVHRDISPANVMISYAGEVKLTDFGIATVVKIEQRTGEPPSGIVRGKLCYMSPEQARGDQNLDHRADLFSLGVLLYECLAGERPFDPPDAEDDEVFERLASGSFIPLVSRVPEISAELAKIVERLLHPNPAKRFRSADDVLDALCALAPPQNLFRELGALARRAKPPQTVEYEAFADESALEALGSEPTPTEVVRLPRLRVRTPVLLRGVFAVVLTAAATSLGLVLSQPESGMQARSVNAASTASAHSPIFVAPAPVASVPTQDSMAESAAATLPAVTTPPPSAPSPSPSLKTEANDESPAEPSQELAKLRVGVVPFAQVWVDGKYRGWSPLTVKLEPNSDHEVAAGQQKPEVNRTVRLGPGEKSSVTLRLP